MREKLINYLFLFSKEPITFLDLVEANSLYNQNHLIDPAKLKFKFRYLRVYLLYFLLCFVILLPLLIMTHFIFEKIDFHFSLLSAIFVTAAVFIGLDIFKIYIRKIVSLHQIKRAWSVHFSHFEYDKYNQALASIYEKAKDEQIAKAKLEQYILSNLIEWRI